MVAGQALTALERQYLKGPQKDLTVDFSRRLKDWVWNKDDWLRKQKNAPNKSLLASGII